MLVLFLGHSAELCFHSTSNSYWCNNSGILDVNVSLIIPTSLFRDSLTSSLHQVLPSLWPVPFKHKNAKFCFIFKIQITPHPQKKNPHKVQSVIRFFFHLMERVSFQLSNTFSRSLIDVFNGIKSLECLIR